jgi:hypothetical protein
VINVINAMQVLTQNCFFGTSALTWAAGCTANPSGGGSPTHAGLSGGATAGIVIGCIVGVALLVATMIAVRVFVIKGSSDANDTTARPLDLGDQSKAKSGGGASESRNCVVRMGGIVSDAFRKEQGKDCYCGVGWCSVNEHWDAEMTFCIDFTFLIESPSK